MSYKTAQNSHVVISIAIQSMINNTTPLVNGRIPDEVFKMTYSINKNSYPTKTIPALAILSNKSFCFSSINITILRALSFYFPIQ